MATIEGIVSETKDRFSIGIQGLAFDIDPTYLLLDNMLLQCHYNVTTTSEALTAMKLLRENKNKFDLVIINVDRPDMDGFKLLELAGLEMDLPVIMLSANGDTELVTKGIARGACDHLLKPVRIEELKKMCQHVVGRNKFDRKDRYSSDSQDKPHADSSEAAGIGNVGNNGKLNKKRIDQNEDDNMDQSPQNKPRVEESGREFVAAFNQLGIERNVDNNENEDHPHSLTFSNKIWNCLRCNVCGKICNTRALGCEEPKCNFIVHWKCLHEQEK